MKIPEIMDELRQLSAAHGIPRLAELADHLRRRSPISRAPVKSQPITPALQRAIVAAYRENPARSQLEIARQFNVNPGRVSEALRGFR